MEARAEGETYVKINNEEYSIFYSCTVSEEADWIQDLDICRIYNPDGVEVEIDPKSDYVDDIERAIMADIKPRWNRLEWHKEYMDGDI